MYPIWHIDHPKAGNVRIEDSQIFIQGWVATDEPTLNLTAINHPEVEFTLTHHPEYRQDLNLPNSTIVGFITKVSPDLVGDSPFLETRIDIGAESFPLHIPLPDASWYLEDSKAHRLKRIEPYLRCPTCKGDLTDQGETVICNECGETFPKTDQHFDFLTEELREQFKIVDTDAVSAHRYDGLAMNYVAAHRDGLVLDCGAGYRESPYPNVINYEIVPYSSTDVLGVGERLPFADNTFDVVFSFAVLEHVTDPFTCAQEMIRVLKPGGILYAQVPFLQPYHGYPHHYYNMTQAGLANLFDQTLETEFQDIQAFGEPIFSLSWFLKSYSEGLPPKAKKKFLKMKVQDLLQDGQNYFAESWVKELPEHKKVELACTTRYLGRKPDPLPSGDSL